MSTVFLKLNITIESSDNTEVLDSEKFYEYALHEKRRGVLALNGTLFCVFKLGENILQKINWDNVMRLFGELKKIN